MATDPDIVEARGFAAFDRLACDLPSLGVALSGGGDSAALLHLAARWASLRKRRVEAATVDHGLRAESAAEADAAARQANALGLHHDVLRWDGQGAGNLMANARKARAELLSGWAASRGLDAVMLGHTRDDVAETLLMRLSRGAGIDGLAAMSERRSADGIVWLRPLLGIGREELRGWLRQIGASWVEDPTNRNEKYDRARIRQAMAALGLEAEALALSATNLAEARDALNAGLEPIIAGARLRHGALLLDRAAFDLLPAESRRRLIIAAVRFVTGANYPPRRQTVEHALQALASGNRATLDGAVLDPGRGLLVHREPAAAVKADLVRDNWDNRWKISGLRSGDRVAAAMPDPAPGGWREAGLTHLEAQALPVVIRDGAVFSPVLAPADGLSAAPLRRLTDLRLILLGH
ncbi:tRNA lysidine(34) synthetase TilS [Paracoccus sp. SCSIO 75233]|uniref:tRNA lysidine(34) synthetase TilS n=1 Tax=Paracoccus sp. SCSIO 75233 TaxID=3017782 RepID=UPI0022F121C1|nr:tRNA lysidine(34) synthetase TilS [Paracoccus sp. SCSIO 75233]WBU53239.1 tRNA lysidine(34) synthetase TilS [Paracoccus sp. SCSIO 75233]